MGLGYSVTYGLHVGHNYAEVQPDEPQLIASEVLAARVRQSRTEQADIEAAAEKPHDEVRWGSEMPKKELRVARTRVAVLNVGGAVMSCALCSVGSSAFLLFATMNIFLKLGGIVMCVTTLSVLLT